MLGVFAIKEDSLARESNWCRQEEDDGGSSHFAHYVKVMICNGS